MRKRPEARISLCSDCDGTSVVCPICNKEIILQGWEMCTTCRNKGIVATKQRPASGMSREIRVSIRVVFVLLFVFDIWMTLFVLNPRSDRYPSDLIALFAVTGTLTGVVVSVISLRLSMSNLEEALRIQKAQLEVETRPNVHIGTRWHGVNLFTYVVNAGRSPVVDLNVEIALSLKEGSTAPNVKPLRMRKSLLLQGDKAQFHVPNCCFDVIKTQYESITIKGTCKDVNGTEHPIEYEMPFNLPDDIKSPEEQIWEVLSDDDPLVQIRKSIEGSARSVGAKIEDVAKMVERIGPTANSYCPKCHTWHSIDVREMTLKCEKCGEELDVF